MNFNGLLPAIIYAIVQYMFPSAYLMFKVKNVMLSTLQLIYM